LTLLIVCFVASTLGAKNTLSDWQLHCFILLNDFQFFLFGIADDYLLLLSEWVVVATEFAYQSIASGGAFDQQQLKAQRAKLH
jgi:hypothetical protein